MLFALFSILSSCSAARLEKREISEEAKKMAEFVGTYKFEKDDGKFDDFLKAMSK